jgi:hypothetical protein
MIGKIIVLVIFLVVVYFAWDFIFSDSNVGENTRGISYEQKQKLLEYQRHMPDNSVIRHEPIPNPGRDQYLQEKYGYIPPQYRP